MTTPTPTGSAPDQPSAQTGEGGGLIARLEAAGVGSRELDAAVWAAVNGYELFEHDGAGWRYRMHATDIMRHERTGYISPYTTSLDAALSLAERVGFGDCFDIQIRPGTARVQRFDGLMGVWRTTEDCATAPLALCAAILKATGDR